MSYNIWGDLTVLLNGVKYESPIEEESAIAKALANLFEPTVARNDNFLKACLIKAWRSYQKGSLSGTPVSDVLLSGEIADILVSAGVYRNSGVAMLDMERILDLKLEVDGGATYIWEEKQRENGTLKYWLRGRHDLSMH